MMNYVNLMHTDVSDYFSYIDKHYEQEEELLTAWNDKMDSILKSFGFVNDGETCYKVHRLVSYFSNGYTTLDTIAEAIEKLALKDGCEVVKFENGNIGVVSYYSGEVDAFELSQPTQEEIDYFDEYGCFKE